MMSIPANWPIPVMTLGASNGGSVLFRKGGKLHATCILKSTFRLVPDEPMQVVEPEELVVNEMHYRDNPTRSIRVTSEIVPYLPRVDVVLTGHAHAPKGRPAKQVEVRLAVYHGIALLEKKLLVIGDSKGEDVVPFERMPLIYEKALGGFGHPLNPWGSNKEGGAAPNIVDPKDPKAVAGYGPISRALRPRKALRGNVAVEKLDESLIELPADFDWNYFQAAPPDQQLASLVGNEWIVLEGMHPTYPRIASRLPTVRPIAVVLNGSSSKQESIPVMHLRLDMLRIDADNLTCSVVSRVIVPIDDERSLKTLRVLGAVETEDLQYAHLLTSSSLDVRQERTATLGPSRVKKSETDRGTIVLGDAPAPQKALPFKQKKFEIEDEATVDMDTSSHHEEGKKPVTPFPPPGPKRASASRRAPIPGAPWSPASARPAKPPRVRTGTVTESTMGSLDEPTRKIPNASLIAVAEPPPPPPPVISPKQIPEPPTVPAIAPKLASEPPAAPVNTPKLASEPPAVVHTTPDARPEPSKEAKHDAPPKELWAAKTGHELPIANIKAPPPKLPAKPAVNKAIYGGFGPAKKKT